MAAPSRPERWQLGHLRAPLPTEGSAISLIASHRRRALLCAIAAAALLSTSGSAAPPATTAESGGLHVGTRPTLVGGIQVAAHLASRRGDLPVTRTGSSVTAPGPHQRRSVLIIIQDSEGRWIPNCTGSMVANRLMLTAGHCADDGTMRLVPGAYRKPDDKKFRRPYGTCVSRSVSYNASDDGWTSENDYALVSIGSCSKGPKNPDGTRYVGTLTGAWPLVDTSNGWWDKGDHVLATAGYPGDKDAGTMWFAHHTTLNNLGDEAGIATGELAGGSSGGPMVAKDADGNLALAAVVRVAYDPYDAGTGSTGGIQGLRMTDDVQDQLSEWAKIMK